MSGDNDLRRMLQVGYLLHAGRTQRAISRQLGLSEATVSRLAERSRGFVELRYDLPGEDELEARLIETFGLRDAVVVEGGGPEQERSVVGSAAARYFTSRVSDGDGVALSCGETLLEMLKVLPSRPGLTLRISQLTVEGDPRAIHQAPATLVGLLRAKSSSESEAIGVQLLPPSGEAAYTAARDAFARGELITRLRAMARRARMLFVGIGAPGRTRGGEVPDFVRLAHEVVSTQAFERFLAARGIAGEINNQLYDADGRDCTDEMPELASQFVHVLTLNDLRALAARPEKHQVVAVASGAEKVPAISAALRGGLVNALITSRRTAEQLIPSSRKARRPRSRSSERAAVR